MPGVASCDCGTHDNCPGGQQSRADKPAGAVDGEQVEWTCSSLWMVDGIGWQLLPAGTASELPSATKSSSAILAQGLPSSQLKGTKITIRLRGWHFPSAGLPALPRLTPVGTENPIRPAHAASRYW